MSAATDIAPSQNYVDVIFAPDAKALVTLSASSMHTLSPDGVVCGPLTLEVTSQMLEGEGFFGSLVLDRVDWSLSRMGWVRTVAWQQHSNGWSAWATPAPNLWPLAERETVLAAVEEGVLP